MNGQYLYWGLTAIAKKLGLLGLIALCLVIASLVFYAIKIPQIKADIANVKMQQADQVKKQAAKVNAIEKPTERSQAEEVDMFYSRFPKVEELPDVIAQLYSIAVQQNIALNIGDYRYKSLKAKNQHKHALNKYEIVLPVEGQYTNIRKFVSQSLKALPEMALIDLQIVREDKATREVSARLVFVVFVKGQTWQQ